MNTDTHTRALSTFSSQQVASETKFLINIIFIELHLCASCVCMHEYENEPDACPNDVHIGISISFCVFVYMISIRCHAP